MIHEQIAAKLGATLQPVYLEVINETYRHNVPVGSESHFKVIIVSDKFLGQPMLARHRSIYDVLVIELATGVHALALHTHTTKEWGELQNKIPASPSCRGAGMSA